MLNICFLFTKAEFVKMTSQCMCHSLWSGILWPVLTYPLCKKHEFFVVLEKIFKFCQYILLACFFLSSKKDRALHSNKFESFNPRMFPSGSELEHFEISSMFFCFVFVLVFLYYISLENCVIPSFVEACIPFTQICFVSSSVKIGPFSLEEKIF